MTVRSRVINKILLVVLSVALSVVVIEGFLMWKPEFQAAVPFERFVFCDGPARRMQEHERFGWTEVPNSAYFEQQSEADGWAVHIYNADGFRDLFDSGQQHVIVLGDSFVRGTLANNNETFSYLLDLWNPHLAFHDFGTGGFGTKNSLSVYESVSSKIEHKLAILVYFLGNDLEDNLQRHSGQDDRSHDMFGKAGSSAWLETLKEINEGLRRARTYNLLYSSVRSLFGKSKLSGRDVEEGVRVTRDLVFALAKQVKDNHADLLIVILPSWNQMNNYEGPEEAVRQRAVLQRIVDEWDKVYLVDLSDTIARVGPEQVYGINNKHFSRYGYYLTAKVVHDWINFEWRGAPRPGRQAPPFQPPSAPVVPDCASIPKYREAFGNQWRPGVGEGPGLAEVGRAAPSAGRLARLDGDRPRR